MVSCRRSRALQCLWSGGGHGGVWKGQSIAQGQEGVRRQVRLERDGPPSDPLPLCIFTCAGGSSRQRTEDEPDDALLQSAQAESLLEQ